MTVAKAADALMPVSRESIHGRMSSPARAGNRKVVANPTTVARNTGVNDRR
jgi:hypothetical protein